MMKSFALNERTRLWTVGAAIALLSALAGLLIGQASGPPAPAPPRVAAPAGAAGASQADSAGGFVEMTPERLAAAGIVTEPVSAGTLDAEILAQASVTAPPEGRSSLTARADGALTRIFKRLGDPVAAGGTVALLESREAAAIIAERAAAQARATAAAAALNRERRLFAARITARQDLEAAQAQHAQAQAELRRTQAAVVAAGVTPDGRHIAVRSLIGGRITKVDAELGAYVSAGTELFEVANPRSIQVEASVPAVEAPRIRPGDPAVIELPSGSTIGATVRSSTPSLDPQSRTVTVVLHPLGIPAGLTQGQGLRVRISPRSGGDSGGRIVVPEDAVQSLNGHDVLFVRQPKGFRAVPVTLGQRGSGRVEILSGLTPGQQVATTNAFLLKAELAKGAGGEE